MAEAILRKLLQDRYENSLDIIVSSAGLYVRDGDPPTEFTLTVLEEAGIKLEGHCSSHLTSHIIEDAGLILTMTTSHKKEIFLRWPQIAEGKTFTLQEFAGNHELDIGDPFGAPIETYRATYETIRFAVASAFDRIVQFWDSAAC